MKWGAADCRASMIDMGDGGCIEIFEGGDGEPPAGGYLHLAFKVQNCDEAFQTALLAGATVQSEPYNVDIPSDPVCPVRIGFVYGLDGEILEFFQYRK